MSKVFVNVGMTLDGYIAPEGMDIAHADDPEYLGWMAKWSQLQDWLFHQEFLRQRLELGEGGETGEDNDIVRRTFERSGVIRESPGSFHTATAPNMTAEKAELRNVRANE